MPLQYIKRTPATFKSPQRRQSTRKSCMEDGKARCNKNNVIDGRIAFLHPACFILQLHYKIYTPL